MSDEKVYTPEVITDNPLPNQDTPENTSTSSSTKETYSPKTTKERKFPTKRIATELLSSVLNTKSRKILQEFELADSGGIRVGRYTNGVSGEVAITPAGITAKNTAGSTTFSIDSETGDATFAGQVQTGAVITGVVDVGNGNIVIDGESRRMVFYDENGVPQIVIGEA